MSLREPPAPYLVKDKDMNIWMIVGLVCVSGFLLTIGLVYIASCMLSSRISQVEENRSWPQ